MTGPDRPASAGASGDAAGCPARGSVGARITALRKQRGWTQERLAGATGVSRSAVAQWETDRAGQGRDNLARIAHALGVSLDVLLHGTQGPPDARGDELALLRLYRDCTEEARAELLRHARRLSASAGRDPRREITKRHASPPRSRNRDALT